MQILLLLLSFIEPGAPKARPRIVTPPEPSWLEAHAWHVAGSVMGFMFVAIVLLALLLVGILLVKKLLAMKKPAAKSFTPPKAVTVRPLQEVVYTPQPLDDSVAAVMGLLRARAEAELANRADSFERRKRDAARAVTADFVSEFAREMQNPAPTGPAASSGS